MCTLSPGSLKRTYVNVWLFANKVPDSIVTKELSQKFKDIFAPFLAPDDDCPRSPEEIVTSPAVIQQVAELTKQLPDENYDLLALLSAHLQKVVDNQSENKMTIGNLQVVFSPTLGISSHLLHVFVHQNNVVFPPRAPVSASNESVDIDVFLKSHAPIPLTCSPATMSPAAMSPAPASPIRTSSMKPPPRSDSKPSESKNSIEPSSGVAPPKPARIKMIARD